mmetsp:Transcript_3210/g.8883  ORF Transcript_3210/g.8883 Transcript_3210/m.8883 type:complete len:361 (+) Transcript_3210:1180-2262(+)
MFPAWRFLTILLTTNEARAPVAMSMLTSMASSTRNCVASLSAFLFALPPLEAELPLLLLLLLVPPPVERERDKDVMAASTPLPERESTLSLRRAVLPIAMEEEEEEEEEEGSEAGQEEEDGPPFLFVHINKTGGTSLISMFSERCEEEYWGEQWLDSEGEYHRAFHATAHAYIAKYGREAWDKAYTFTVVRHPLARQVSNFFFLASMGCDTPNNKCEERLIPVLDFDSMTDDEKIEAFTEWIVKLYDTFPPGSPEHYRFGAAGHGNEVYDTFGASQTSWNVDANGKMVTKDFYKLEELSKDISVLANKIPCLKNGPLDMAKKNKTSKYPDFMLFAKDERTKKIINEVFADDFKIFGYDPL